MTPCPGPMIWFSVRDNAAEEYAAVLECASCGYFIGTGAFLDPAHVDTPVLREGLAS